jgi:ribosomal protein L37E
MEASDFITQLLCKMCGQQGHAIWMHNVTSQQAFRTATSPIGTSDSFYLRVGKNQSANPHIVCGRCGSVYQAEGS